MCQYRPYVHTCNHGTSDEPANYLVDACDNPLTSQDTLCRTPVFLHRPIGTGLPCWTCHQTRMRKLMMTPNIWKYLMILERMVTGASEVKDMIPELRNYYALSNAAHTYDIGQPVMRDDAGNDDMDSPSYWNNGIADLLRLVGVPGRTRSTDGDGKTGDGMVSPELARRSPRSKYSRQPVMTVDGFTFESENGAKVEMIEWIFDNDYESNGL